MNRALLLVVLLAAGCVSSPEIPADICKETRRVSLGRESAAVDFYFRLDKRARPLAVIVHGFLANKGRMAHWALILAREGFVVAVPDNPTRANDDRNTAAVVALVEGGRAGEWPIAAAADGRAVLVGFSRGGFETLLAAAELGDRVDAWIGLDPVDRDGKGKAAAAKMRAPGLALQADPQPLNANGNARGMLANYAGPLQIVRVPGAGHLNAESPDRHGKFGLFRGRVIAFLDKVIPRH